MRHLDEGTIHGWLDGALDATQSREIESHIAQCPTCSAKVAEARGLVAASSRILTALDEVPGGVVPKRAAPPPIKPARRQWRAAPWVTGIAAALILVVGLSTLQRQGRLATKGETDGVLTSPVTAPSQQVALDTTAAKVAAAPAALDEVQTTSTAANRPVAPARRDRLQNAQRVQSAPRDMDLAARRAGGVAEGKGAVTGAAGSAVESRAAAAPPPTAPMPVAATSDAAALKIDVATKSAAEPEGERIAGCYRLQVAQLTRQSVRNEMPTAAGAAAVSKGRARAVAPSAAAERSVADYAAAPAAPEVVRLDSVARPLGYPVRFSRSDSTIVGWWSRWGSASSDSAQVRMLAGYALIVSAKDRVTCPER